LNQPTHLLFDLDGTLTDSREGITRCIQHALIALGHRPPPASALHLFIGPSLHAGFSCLLDTSDARRVLEHLEMAGWFEGVYGPELSDRFYDKSVLIRLALESIGCQPGQAIMIGDRADDILGARRNGIRSVGVTWGYGDVSELTAAGPDAIVSSLGSS
jgi:phosphoglycolate phosphatase